MEEVIPYDLLVGADGADSIVRERMVQAKVSGRICGVCLCVGRGELVRQGGSVGHAWHGMPVRRVCLTDL